MYLTKITKIISQFASKTVLKEAHDKPIVLDIKKDARWQDQSIFLGVKVDKIL